MRLGYKLSTLELPFAFIDSYLTGCAPVYPLIYIFSLRRLIGGEPVTIPEIARHFGLLETDVINAWRHFEAAGLVLVEGSGVDIDITFLPVEASVESMGIQPVSSSTEIAAPKRTLSFADASPSEPASTPMGSAPSLAPSTASTPSSAISAHSDSPGTRTPWRETPPPQYSAEELAIYRTQSKDIARLFSKAEQALGRLLKCTDMSTIFSFHDWLRLPLDVIEYLLCYCEEHGHRNLRYIEKCALDWADQGIDDLEKALTYVQAFDKEYRSILKHMGKLSTFPTPAQRKLMDKWLHEMDMPLDVIIAACDKTTVVAEKPSLSYVDKILAKWKKAGIMTLEAVQQADADFETKQAEKDHAEKSQKGMGLNEKPSARTSKPKNNRFINFDQRENDYSHIEQMERQYLLKRLNG